MTHNNIRSRAQISGVVGQETEDLNFSMTNQLKDAINSSLSKD